MQTNGYLIFESGESFKGKMWANTDRAGEVVFNTSHSGYEEMATDPSYFNQILLTTAPMQGNYGESDTFWESDKIWINGFICLDLQSSERDSTWKNKLLKNKVPILTEIDTRKIVLKLRQAGTTWGALIRGESNSEAQAKARELILAAKSSDKDWANTVSSKETYTVKGDIQNGIRIALLDFGSKKNIIRELAKRCQTIKVFPSRATAKEIKTFDPHGIMLSNGPGNPGDVEVAVNTVKELLGWRFIFGICMGHQILSLALGAKTYKLKFGHRGSNHPIKDRILQKVYMTSQNHGYAVDVSSLPKGVEVTHLNLNDQTVSGISSTEQKCMSVQFHPESHPGPHDAETLFDYFIKQVK